MRAATRFVPILIPHEIALGAGTVAITTAASGPLRAIRPLPGSVGAVFSASGPLHALRPLPGTIAIVVQTSGILRAMRPLPGTVAILTGASGSLEKIAAAIPDLFPRDTLIWVTSATDAYASESQVALVWQATADDAYANVPGDAPHLHGGASE